EDVFDGSRTTQGKLGWRPADRSQLNRVFERRLLLRNCPYRIEPEAKCQCSDDGSTPPGAVRSAVGAYWEPDAETDHDEGESADGQHENLETASKRPIGSA